MRARTMNMYMSEYLRFDQYARITHGRFTHTFSMAHPRPKPQTISIHAMHYYAKSQFRVR